jgi:hypothetical protein
MDTSVIDITTVDLVVNALHYIFPTFDYRYNQSMGATVLWLLPTASKAFRLMVMCRISYDREKDSDLHVFKILMKCGYAS